MTCGISIIIYLKLNFFTATSVRHFTRLHIHSMRSHLYSLSCLRKDSYSSARLVFKLQFLHGRDTRELNALSHAYKLDFLHNFAIDRHFYNMNASVCVCVRASKTRFSQNSFVIDDASGRGGKIRYSAVYSLAAFLCNYFGFSSA
jgi:hypothetical protein